MGKENNQEINNTNKSEMKNFPSHFDQRFLGSEVFKSLGFSPEGQLTEEQIQKLNQTYEKWNNDNSKNNAPQNVLTVNDHQAATTPNENQEWIKQYNDFLTSWGEEHQNKWSRDNEYTTGLKGKFKKGTELEYTTKDRVSVNIPEGEKYSADHFTALVALAKEVGQDIKIGKTISPEFKSALIEACAKGGVSMFGLTPEEQKMYDNFKSTATNSQGNNEERTENIPSNDTQFKLDPIITQRRLAEYSRRISSDNEGINLFAEEISKTEKDIEKGHYQANEIDKVKAETLLKKYILAENKNDTKTMETCETALQYYGLDSISQEPKGSGRYVVKEKPFANRNNEEKAKINQTMEQAFLKQKSKGHKAPVQAVNMTHNEGR